MRSGQSPRIAAAELELLSPLRIELLADYDGATWLDEQLGSERPEPCRDADFGHEVRRAQAACRRWLGQHELGGEEGG
jgi:hypothetical protein